MPARPEGVYRDKGGRRYFKVTVSTDPLTGRREQLTRRGFRTVAEATAARREVLAGVSSGGVRPSSSALNVNQLLDLYLDGIDADGKLSAKTCHDYRVYAETYVRPLLGRRRVRDVTPELVLAWQRQLLTEDGGKRNRVLAPNTVRLARSPLSGAFKPARHMGILATSPLDRVPGPTPRRKVPRHWSPEQAREFLTLMEGDRTYPVWAFLLGSGLRIGELVALRWPNVDLESQVVRVVDFHTYLGQQVVNLPGKSRDAVRSVDIDAGLVRALRSQLAEQARERLASSDYVMSEFVFTKPNGGAYHPQYPPVSSLA